MSVVLTVDGPRWRASADAVASQLGGIVPVVKGNGYGFGRALLCRETDRLGADTVAVGTYAELPGALEAFSGDVLVMEPYRAVIHGSGVDAAHLADPRVVHTVTTIPDHEDLVRQGTNRAVVEGLTTMNRFGAGFEHFGSVAARPGIEGGTLHLPLGSGHVSEISRWVREHADVRTWFVSHVTAAELARLRSEFPDRTFRPRVGTALWLGDKGAYRAQAHVLDVRPVGRPVRAGYRQRPVDRGFIVVLSGGTSHGVAMESPSAADSLRSRAIAVAEGVMEAGHRVRSPFTVDGALPYFVEPPHMQCSIVHLPAGTTPPRVGDLVPVRLRLTTAYVDEVRFSDGADAIVTRT